MKEKMDTLSDAIVAIAMTILVLEIKAPETVGGMPEFIQQVLLFILSFIVIANFWYERMFFTTQTEDTDFRMITLDLVIYLGICFIPLLTKFMFTYEDMRVSVVTYGIVILIVSTLLDVKMYLMMKLELTKNHYEREAEVLRLTRQFHLRAFYSSTVLVILSYFFPFIIVYFYSLVPVARFIGRGNQGRRLMTKPETMLEFADSIIARRDVVRDKKKGRNHVI